MLNYCCTETVAPCAEDVLLDALAWNDRITGNRENFYICGKFTRFYHRFTRLIFGGLRNKVDNNSLILNRFVILNKHDIDICKRLLNRGVKPGDTPNSC